MDKTVYIRTFGCQMNVHDTEKIIGVLQKDGYSQTGDPCKADLIIFNTCSIRQKAEQKFYSELGSTKSYKKRRPEIKIAVAGCIAQLSGKNILRRAPYVDFVFGPQNIHKISDMVSEKAAPLALEDNSEITIKDLPVKRTDGLKAWVTIMYGCNNFCSYCIVPYTRGRERSRPSENIYSEVVELADNGYKEITLLGQNVNSYRSDTDFPGLLRKLNRVGGIERIRFVTSHPRDLSKELITAISELPKVCRHIHLPLQSGSSNILRLMNRGYTYDDYIRKVARLREKVLGISVTSDIIAGFPSETEDDHLLTIKALKEIEFDGIFAFKYSKRPGTKAAGMQDHLKDEIKSERLNEILKIQDEITTKKNKLLEGTTHEILLEGESETDKGKLTGRTRTNKIVHIPKIDIEKGTLIKVEITKGRRHSLEAIV
ncbi:MAG: tRNA (N6-isopentenyl adenosine(37)-C2)-methylthiotransferase MiaB [Thermodesulfovibrio sp. RBG_19FT_COMBO_42_12]|nr:MAG: tRNA (N6-isopentenyl adenosine(37)-C2)-methylthiotransferase MiaB [Thermodesulfovibrio sp. RBG_19FT_COMBO_42_12]